jgi:PIN domain nuclease of toxin-antitoxin system
MSLLLDSNAVVYWLNQPHELSAVARDEIGNAAVVYVSVASIWELDIKRAADKLSLSDKFWDALEKDEITVLPIERSDAFRPQGFPCIIAIRSTG